MLSAFNCLFNAYVKLKYYPKIFKRANTVVLRKLKKNDYIDLKAYRLIALLNTIKKALKLVVVRKLTDVTKTNHLLPAY